LTNKDVYLFEVEMDFGKSYFIVAKNWRELIDNLYKALPKERVRTIEKLTVNKKGVYVK